MDGLMAPHRVGLSERTSSHVVMSPAPESSQKNVAVSYLCANATCAVSVMIGLVLALAILPSALAVLTCAGL
jgi:hypothetical protein